MNFLIEAPPTDATIYERQTVLVPQGEPRPPLFYGIRSGNVSLVAAKLCVFVHLGPHPAGGQVEEWLFWTGRPGPLIDHPYERGIFDEDSSRPYTGPISDAMWRIIKKWWLP